MASCLIRSQRVVLPDGMRPATIRIDEGRISAINPYAGSLNDGAASPLLIDAGSAVVMPGLVDTHVHINDPGRADWEGFETATLAAAAGGWILAAGLLGVAAATAMGNVAKLRLAEVDPGMTTEIALLVMYGVGAYVVLGDRAVAVVLISLARGFNADLFAILFGSILTVTSYADRTSPVVRGKWLLENILGTYRAAYTPATPLVNLTLTQASIELDRQTMWAAAGSSSVTGYVQAGQITISNPAGIAVPFTAPAGTIVNGTALLPYGGEVSAWLAPGSTTGTLPGPSAQLPTFTSAASAGAASARASAATRAARRMWGFM